MTGDPRRAAADSLRARETLVDRRIREAMEDGKFDDLPFRGEPIPLEDDTAAGEWAMAFRILRNAELAPPWIEADKEVRRLLARRDALLERARREAARPSVWTRREFVRVIDEANRAIASLNAAAPTDRQHRRPLDVDAELARLDALARATGADGRR